MTDKLTKLNMAITIIIALIFIGFSYRGIFLFDIMEKHIYDMGVNLSGSETRDKDEIVLINIDNESLAEIGPWPWPRHILTKMVDRLKDNNIKVIGLNIPLHKKELNQGLSDIIFFREKIDSYPLAQKNPILKKWILDNLDQFEKDIDNDTKLADSIEKSNNVILRISTNQDNINTVSNGNAVSILSKNFLAYNQTSPPDTEKIILNNIELPYMVFGEKASGMGCEIQLIDKVMGSRSHYPFLSYNGSFLPSFPLRLAMAYYDQHPGEITADESQIKFKEHVIPLFGSAMLINFKSNPNKFNSLSSIDLLNGTDFDQKLEGKLAVIGFSHSNTKTYDTPITPNMLEQNLIANILSTILNGNPIYRPYYLLYIEMILILIFGISSSLFLPQKRTPLLLAWTIILTVITITTGLFLLSLSGIWFKSSYIISYIACIFIFNYLWNFRASRNIAKGSYETNKLLGLNLQSQGHVEQAMEKFLKLPLNNETRNLIYSLGLEFEKRNLIGNAISAFEYVNKGKGFRDLDNRISRLKKSNTSSITGNHGSLDSGVADSIPDKDKILKIGRYDILGELGKGSMGIVYKAQDPSINRLVAIKTIRFSDEFDEDVIQEIKERFFREAEIAGKLSHSSIVTIHDVGDENDLTYMAMEFLEGEDLHRFIQKENLLPLRKVLNLIGKVAEALDFAHKAGVIHRDIKPANVMLLKNGQIKVTDFGIAKAISSSRTRAGVILGTPNYMSPEQIMGQKIDARSDIFSLGILFFQLLTGELPFHGENLSNLLYQITQVEHPSPRRFNPKIPIICEQILSKTLEKHPDKRFKSAGELAKVVKTLGTKIDELIKIKNSKK